MVAGIEKLRHHLSGHEDKYVVIGGAACDLLFDVRGLLFRATKDIDMVLCIEAEVDAAFAAAFKKLLEAGGYEARRHKTGKREFYRFQRTAINDYPYMIELFSRTPDALNLPDDTFLAPLDVENDIVSLSAILLTEDYYQAISQARTIESGVSIIDETLLIPFKAHAYLNLIEDDRAGRKVKKDDIKKHRNDVFRLSSLLSLDASVHMSERIKSDLKKFLELVEADKGYNLEHLPNPVPIARQIKLIRDVYDL